MKENLITMAQRSETEARELGRAGGIASGEARRRKKTIAAALRKVLEEKTSPDSDETRLDAITRKALYDLHQNPSMKGLKILTEILGELDVNLNLGESSEVGIRIVDTRKKGPEHK